MLAGSARAHVIGRLSGRALAGLPLAEGVTRQPGLRHRIGGGGIAGWLLPHWSQARRLPGSAEPKRQAGPRQSSAGCQSTGGGSEPCLMMLA